jgi:hypothetical protein
MTSEIIPLELLSKGDPGLDETAVVESDVNIGKVAKQLGVASARLRFVALSTRLSATIDEVRAFCF